MGRWQRPWQRGLCKETERGEKKEQNENLVSTHTYATYAREREREYRIDEGGRAGTEVHSIIVPSGSASRRSRALLLCVGWRNPPPLKSSSQEKHSPFLLLTFLPGWLNQVTTFLAHHLWKCPFGTTLLWRTMALLSLSRSSRSLSGRSRPLAWFSPAPQSLLSPKQLFDRSRRSGNSGGSAGHKNNKGFLLWLAFSGPFLAAAGKSSLAENVSVEDVRRETRRENTKVDFPC